jgi:hypothetical protein
VYAGVLWKLGIEGREEFAAIWTKLRGRFGGVRRSGG